MKQYLSIGVAAASALMLSAACGKEMQIIQPQPEGGETELKIKLNTYSGGPTKAGGYTVDTETHGKEDSLGTVQLFVFDADGLEKYVKVADWNNDIKEEETLNIGVKVGTKSIVAICNGPDLSAVNSISQLKASEFELASYNDPGKGFIMFGEADCTVTGDKAATCSIEVTRFVAKVYIASVTNNLSPQFGNLTLDYAFLANVPGKCSLGGTVNGGVWLNRYGRADETPLVSEHIIDGSTWKASAPNLTFAGLGQASVIRGNAVTDFDGLYTLQNTSSVNTNAFSPTFSPCGTKLVIAATIKGERNYYSVNLGKLYANNVYAVYLTVSGQGASDPAESIVKGNMESTITVTGWKAGAPVVEDF